MNVKRKLKRSDVEKEEEEEEMKKIDLRKRERGREKMERNVRVIRITGRTPFPEEKGTKTRRGRMR